jgi:S-formylglutathione hydrolase FrmB
MKTIHFQLILFPLYFLLSSCSLFSPKTGIADTYTFYSGSISELSSVAVYYPEDYGSSTPVIYLLNGWGADALAWGTGMDLAQEAHDRDLFLVSLSAGSNTYTDNSGSTGKDYEAYVLEVVSKVEKEYDIEIDSTARALCGISNGGGGATFILSEHPDMFMACGSLSGTVYSGMTQYGNFANRGLRIDVGTEDGGLSSLRWLHTRLDEENIDHEYYEHPGRHDWTFWKKYGPKQFDYLQAMISE